MPIIVARMSTTHLTAMILACASLMLIVPSGAVRAQSPLESLATEFALSACVSQQFEPAERIERCSDELDDANTPRAIGISLVGRGWAKFELGRNHEAIADFRQAMERGTDEIRPDALLGLGYAYNEVGDVERAIDSFEQVTSLARYPFHAYAALGSVRASLGQYDLAVENFDQALAISPSFVPALVARGETYLRFGEYEAALRDLDRSLELSPNDVRALGARGEVHCVIGNLEQSVEDTIQIYILLSHEARIQLQSMLTAGGYYDGPLDGGSEDEVFRAIQFGAEDLCAV